MPPLGLELAFLTYRRWVYCNAGLYVDEGLRRGWRFAGIGVGTLAAPPLCRLLVESLGWRETFQVLSACVLLLGLLAA